LYKKTNIYSYYIDFSDELLKKIIIELNSKMSDLSKFKKYSPDLKVNFQEFYSNYREYYESSYKKEIINSILYNRALKYEIPIS